MQSYGTAYIRPRPLNKLIAPNAILNESDTVLAMT
jgi:hypothetical protein